MNSWDTPSLRLYAQTLPAHSERAAEAELLRAELADIRAAEILALSSGNAELADRLYSTGLELGRKLAALD